MTSFCRIDHASDGRGWIKLFYEKSSTIYSQGQSLSTWYEIIRGTVRTCVFTPDGQRQITGFHFEGDVFGGEEGARGETAEAVTDVVLRAHRRMRPIGSIGVELVAEDKTLLERALVTARHNLALLGRRTAIERVAAFLISLPIVPGRPDERHLPMPRADIADHLGLTMHTVSRVLAGFARQNLIDCAGKHVVRIAAPARLLRLAGGGCSPDGDILPAPQPIVGRATAA